MERGAEERGGELLQIIRSSCFCAVPRALSRRAIASSVGPRCGQAGNLHLARSCCPWQFVPDCGRNEDSPGVSRQCPRKIGGLPNRHLSEGLGTRTLHQRGSFLSYSQTSQI